MPNIITVSFTSQFTSDGSNTLVLDLSSGPVSFGLQCISGYLQF